VTITLNDPAGLRFTLGSLRLRFDTWPSSAWEHVVVDGSPAISRPVLDDIRAGGPLVHVEESPRGVPEAFNRGLDVARGAHVWFLNGGDGLHDVAARGRLLTLLERDPAVDFVGGGAYLTRHGAALYPTTPRRSLLANLLGRNWIYHQAVIYRRTTLRRRGPSRPPTARPRTTTYHLRCYAAGLRGRFTPDIHVGLPLSASCPQMRKIRSSRLPGVVAKGDPFDGDIADSVLGEVDRELLDRQRRLECDDASGRGTTGEQDAVVADIGPTSRIHQCGSTF
jgi:hypothetical protein